MANWLKTSRKLEFLANLIRIKQEIRLERKEADENAHDFISKMVTEREECRAFLGNARSLLASIGSGPSHVDAAG